ncbi:hypothetical protein DUNSADRAFT_15176 [Dunaliella salina]|uniref:Ribonuclease J beta-CASP domain-containing protein n=1 Tax=Dunaliella salina TaxID=3046 RepID=A0ABQ7G5Y1_DUNSA|nr:hypothetical protein DUNSADRAFT_15176 [Dunaliella salina]|eukprot:KAF5830002.1 hypothetical protein DUNSADRAFT_15176 [Dunaliella salina]
MIAPAQLKDFDPSQVLIVTTGSQAEPRAQLSLAALDQSPLLKIQPDDLILYSAKVIPGNEPRVSSSSMAGSLAKVIGSVDLVPYYNDGSNGTGDAREMAIQERTTLAFEGIVVAAVDVIRPAVGGYGSNLQGQVRVTVRGMWTDEGRLLEELHEHNPRLAHKPAVSASRRPPPPGAVPRPRPAPEFVQARAPAAPRELQTQGARSFAPWEPQQQQQQLQPGRRQAPSRTQPSQPEYSTFAGAGTDPTPSGRQSRSTSPGPSTRTGAPVRDRSPSPGPSVRAGAPTRGRSPSPGFSARAGAPVRDRPSKSPPSGGPGDDGDGDGASNYRRELAQRLKQRVAAAGPVGGSSRGRGRGVNGRSGEGGLPGPGEVSSSRSVEGGGRGRRGRGRGESREVGAPPPAMPIPEDLLRLQRSQNPRENPSSVDDKEDLTYG